MTNPPTVDAEEARLEKVVVEQKRIRWRLIDRDGNPPINIACLVYRPNASGVSIFGSDIRKEEFHGAFAHTRPDAPVVAWVPLLELMETL